MDREHAFYYKPLWNIFRTPANLLTGDTYTRLRRFRTLHAHTRARKMRASKYRSFVHVRIRVCIMYGFDINHRDFHTPSGNNTPLIIFLFLRRYYYYYYYYWCPSVCVYQVRAALLLRQRVIAPTIYKPCACVRVYTHTSALEWFFTSRTTPFPPPPPYFVWNIFTALKS